MKILTSKTVVLRGGRTVPPNSVITVPDSHAEALLRNNSAVLLPRKYLRISGLTIPGKARV